MYFSLETFRHSHTRKALPCVINYLWLAVDRSTECDRSVAGAYRVVAQLGKITCQDFLEKVKKKKSLYF